MTFTAKRKISCERLADAASSLRQRKNNEKTKICSRFVLFACQGLF